MNQDYHVFQGMRQDNPPIRQNTNFLWDAYNIRLTNRGDNSLLNVSNEKGNKELLTLEGRYVGHCIVGDYLVVFTVSRDRIDKKYYTSIYRIDKVFNVKTLISKLSLAMNLAYIETLGVYEGEFVQKVYWVDGINQPRVINIVADKLAVEGGKIDSVDNYVYPEGCFDFIRNVKLVNYINIYREEGNGSFAPGVIQYAFSYYDKYGQETNIVETSELLYISNNNRGASAEENIPNIFNIRVTIPDNKFDYLRIYSIHRTSLDATPTVKIVTDIELNGKADINYTDNGLSGDIIDPTRLLFIGGETISALTLTQKDNTLFLGNIKTLREEVSSTVKDIFKDAVKNNRVSCNSRSLALEEDYSNSDTIYKWQNQLQANDSITTFKTGETYRLGVQLQTNTGKWSEPIWIGDYEVPHSIENRPYIDESSNSIIVPYLRLTLSNNESELLKTRGYKRIRGVIVLPSTNDRTILAQGILCPTVFSVKDRVSNTPFAQSSWFFRPMTGTIDDAINDTDIMKGSIIAYRNLEPLRRGAEFKDTANYHLDRGGEIQNMRYGTFKEINNLAVEGTTINTFFVDQSILTFHSPDIEFDNNTELAIDNKNLELNIVGIAPIKSNVGDITIQTSSTTPTSDDSGFLHKSLLNTNDSSRSLVAGMFYNSHIVQADTNAESFSSYESTSDNGKSITSVSWMIYPWQRSGSLNNDCVRPTNKGTRTSVLKRKVISNLRFSKDNSWFNTIWKPSMGITSVSIFNSNEISLLKIPAPLNSRMNDINYYGNIDTLITTDKTYTFQISSVKDWKTGVNKGNPFVATTIEGIPSEAYQYANQLGWTTEPVRMKYKSTPHAVFALNYKDNNVPVSLPNINGINPSVDLNEVGTPFWIKQKQGKSVVIDKYIKLSNFIGDSISSIIISSITEEEKVNQIQDILNKTCTPSMGYRGGDYMLTFSSSSTTLGEYFDIYKSIDVDENTLEWYKLTRFGYQYCKYVGTSNTYITKNDYLEAYYPNGQYGSVTFRKLKSDDVYNVSQDVVSYRVSKPVPNGLYIAELRRAETPVNRFGGTTEEALKNNLWIPAGKPSIISDKVIIDFTYGDTYYQRYDCLKTYAFTNEDENSIVDIGSFMCETRVNLDGRYDKNRGQSSNLNMSPANFNLINKVYSQKDTFFNYRIYDKSFYYTKQNSSQILWSLQKNNLEDIDTWTNVTLANSLELDRSNGVLKSLQVFNETILAFQDKGISQVLFNSRVQIPTSDGVPIEISNSYKVDGTRTISDTVGCQSSRAITKSPLGLYFIDSNTSSFYLFNGQLSDLGTKCGITTWLKDSQEYSNSYLKLSYDPKYKDVYIHNSKEALCYSEQLEQCTSRMGYPKTDMIYFNNESISYSVNNKNFGQYDTILWENFKGEYNKLFNKVDLPYFTYISNENPTYTKIFDTIEYRANFYSNNNYVSDKSFDWIRVQNDYQDTGNKPLTQSRTYVYKNNASLRHKFRIWRAQIPRELNSRNRIRDIWSSITLGFNESEDTNFKFELGDISTKYSI